MVISRKHLNRTSLSLVLSSIPAIYLFWWPIEPLTANRCFVIIYITVCLWISNYFQMFVPALLMPLLFVVFRVIRGEDEDMVLGSKEASKVIISSMCSPTVLVMIASLCIAIAIKKYPIKYSLRAYASFSKLSLVTMLATLFLCILMPNLSSITIMMGMTADYLRGDSSLDANQRRAILLSITMAANIGGFISPISSPQSVYAFSLAEDYDLGVSWARWLFVTIPTAIVCVLVAWLWILYSHSLFFQSLQTTHHSPIIVVDDDDENGDEDETCLSNNSVESKQNKEKNIYLVILIAALTISLWSLSTKFEAIFGSSGVIALIPIISLFGGGLLKVEDLREIPWDIVLLVMGSMTLNTAAILSGLLKVVSLHLGEIIRKASNWPQIWLTCLFIIANASINSRMISAMIFLPVIIQLIVDKSIADGPQFYMCMVMAVSAAVAMPFNGIVNMTAMGAIDRDGERILQFRDLLRIGAPVTVFNFLVICTVGYALS